MAVKRLWKTISQGSKDELGEARQSLQQTLADVGQKVEAVGTQLQPDILVKRNPLPSLRVAGALGLAAGSRGEKPVVVAAFVLGGLLGTGAQTMALRARMLNAMQGRDLDPIGTPGAEAGWPTLLARMLEDASRIVHAELRLFEANLTPLRAVAVDRAIAGLVLLHAGLIGGGCLLTAIILLLHRWLEWWESFGIAGTCGYRHMIGYLYQEISSPEGGRELKQSQAGIGLRLGT